jgi:hypothetical protein
MILHYSITSTFLNVTGCLKSDYQRYIQGGMGGYTQDRSYFATEEVTHLPFQCTYGTLHMSQ